MQILRRNTGTVLHQKKQTEKSREIGGDSIIAYSYHYAYLHDMPISSCRCLCLLSKRMKNNVKKAGISNVDKVSDVRKNFVELSSLTDYEVVDFIRKYSTKI